MANPSADLVAALRLRFVTDTLLPFTAYWQLRTSLSRQPGTDPVPTVTDGLSTPFPFPVDKERDFLTVGSMADFPEPVVLSEMSGKPLNSPELVVGPGIAGGLRSGTSFDTSFMAHWDMGRGDTGADAGSGFAVGDQLDLSQAYARCVGSSNMSYFNLAVDDVNKPNFGRVYVSAIDSWKRYPGMPDFGAPSTNIYVFSRYYLKTEGFMSGIARDTAIGQSFGAMGRGRMLSAQFTETVVLGANLPYSQVISVVGQHVTRITGWRMAPFTYDIAAGVLKFYIGF